MREKPAVARKISQLAEQQQGNVARQQLLALGASDDAIDHRITTGELIPRYAGVYVVGHRSPGPIPIAAAVVLACGDDAVLSHDSAAALWGFGRSRRTDDELLEALDDARASGYLGRTALEDVIGRCRRLSRLVDPASGPTRSKLERAFKRFAKKYDLPPYRLNVWLHGYEVDVVFDAEKLIVELDGWIFHRGRRSHDENRERATHLKDHGFDTIRITSKRLGEREAARLHRILRNQR